MVAGADRRRHRETQAPYHHWLNILYQLSFGFGKLGQQQTFQPMLFITAIINGLIADTVSGFKKITEYRCFFAIPICRR